MKTSYQNGPDKTQRSNTVAGTSWTGATSYYALLFILFIFGVQVPIVSSIVMLVAVGIFALKKGPRLTASFKIPFALLLLFSTSYFIITVQYEFFTPYESIRTEVLIMASYYVGYSFNRTFNLNNHGKAVAFFLCLIGGHVIYSLLSISSDASMELLRVDSGRMERDFFWTKEGAINAAILGAASSLGICILPALMLGLNLKREERTTILLPVGLLLSGAGFYVNLILQNRTPFIALFGAIVLCFGGGVYFFRGKRGIILKTVVIFLAISAGAILFFAKTGANISELSVYGRFTIEGIDTGGRIVAWKRSLNQFFDFPLGGRNAYIGGLAFVHNAWLDIWYDAGILPAVLLAAFHVIQIKNIIKIMRSERLIMSSFLIVGIGSSIFANMLQEPTMLASALYFCTTCIFFGFVQGLSERVYPAIVRKVVWK